MILTKVEILDLMNTDIADPKSLYISTILSEDQIGDDTINIRLGTYFLIFQNTSIECVRLSDLDIKHIADYQAIVHIPLGEEIIIPPNTLILGISLEYIKMPNCVYGEVGTRSSWGRLGLVIATAINIHQNFRGCLTLELVNHGNIPLALSPGIEIGQLVLHKLTREINTEYKFTGKYTGCVKPEFTRIYEEQTIIKRLREISRTYHSQF